MSYPSQPGVSASTPISPYFGTPPAPPPKTTNDSPYNQHGPSFPPQSFPTNAAGAGEPQEMDGRSIDSREHLRPQTGPQTPQIESDWLPELLKDKSTADLHAILNDPALQTALLHSTVTTHPAIPATQAALQPLIESNIASAESLLELEGRLQQQRTHTQSRLLSLRALEQQHRTKLAETEKALQSFSPGALYKRLATSAQEQEALVQGLAQSWLEEGGVASDREVTEFVRRVKESKKIAFLRRERRERWDEGRVGGWR